MLLVRAAYMIIARPLSRRPRKFC